MPKTSGEQPLLIFLKEPRAGTVKTRLAQAVGPHAACEIYRACVELTLERLRRFCDNTILCVDPPHALDAVRVWVGAAWTLRPQRGQTLGDRLAEATAHAFAQGDRRLVVIGTDSPWLQPPKVEQAFAALERHDVVIGPAEDGGYYLIGLSRAVPALFDGMAWGTDAVLAQTMARARALGLRSHPLPLGYDVDRLEDLERFMAEERADGRSTRQLNRMEQLLQRSVHSRESTVQRAACAVERGPRRRGGANA